MNDALRQLEQQYTALLNNYDDLLAKCTTDDQKTAFKTAFVTARRNYWAAINKAFHTDDPKVEDAIEKMKELESGMESEIKKLDDIAKTITAVTTAVAAGGELLALAG